MELYRDAYGCVACLRTSTRTGSCRLTVRSPQGKLIHAKDYGTHRGARIAMGRMSDWWERKWN